MHYRIVRSRPFLISIFINLDPNRAISNETTYRVSFTDKMTNGALGFRLVAVIKRKEMDKHHTLHRGGLHLSNCNSTFRYGYTYANFYNSGDGFRIVLVRSKHE